MRVVVVGASGVAGGAAIEAVRQRHASDVDITALWYGKGDPELAVDGANRTIYCDISSSDATTMVKKLAGEEFDWCFYATALGEVGFPSSEATPEQISESNRLSFDPILRLEEELSIGTMVAYSTFYNLAHQRITYGAMAHSKRAIEEWAITPGANRRRCLRAGAFRSGSSQGIKLLVRRRARELANSNDPLLRSFFVDEKPSVAVEKMEKAVFEEERQTFGDSGTDASSLVTAHLALFDGDAPFINVCGKRIWGSSEPLPLERPETG